MPICGVCNQNLPRGRFSSSQLKKKDDAMKRCMECRSASLGIQRQPVTSITGASIQAKSFVPTVHLRAVASKSTSTRTLTDTIATVYATAGRGIGGLILVNTATGNTFLSLEFMGKGVLSVMGVEFVESPTMESAERFLRGETFEVARISSFVYNDFKTHLVQTSRSKDNLIDLLSGCYLFEGVIQRVLA
ncbi:hypothetical protein MPSEU_000865500 [Mayamaea pseudoterrestris]|nr:hypothetical protein MPSEU_000865500 [Mayamaea pseudoterrestris]